MDPDLVREQEEAERAAAGLPPRKKPTGPAAPIQSRHAVRAHAAILDVEARTAPEPLPGEKAAPSAKEAANANRRALPPMGAGRLPGEEPPPRRRVRGLLRLFLYAIGGAAVGAVSGFFGSAYFDLFKEQTEFFISCMAGGFALLFGLTHLLHYDH